MWRWVLCGLVLAAPSSSHAISGKRVPVPEYSCALLDKGLYKLTGSRVQYADPGSVTGERFEVDTVEFTQQTSTIAMIVGRGFGIRYRIDGLPVDRDFLVTWRITYPRPGVKNFADWEHSFREVSGDGSLLGLLLYDFVFAWEMVRGSWRFEVLVDNVPTCSFTFLAR